MMTGARLIRVNDDKLHCRLHTFPACYRSFASTDIHWRFTFQCQSCGRFRFETTAHLSLVKFYFFAHSTGFLPSMASGVNWRFPLWISSDQHSDANTEDVQVFVLPGHRNCFGSLHACRWLHALFLSCSVVGSDR